MTTHWSHNLMSQPNCKKQLIKEDTELNLKKKVLGPYYNFRRLFTHSRTNGFVYSCIKISRRCSHWSEGGINVYILLANFVWRSICIILKLYYILLL